MTLYGGNVYRRTADGTLVEATERDISESIDRKYRASLSLRESLERRLPGIDPLDIAHGECRQHLREETAREAHVASLRSSSAFERLAAAFERVSGASQKEPT